MSQEPRESVIGVCAWRDIEIPTVTCLMTALKDGWEILFQWNEAVLARSRARLTYRFLREFPQSETLVFIDTDSTFPQEALEGVVRVAQSKNAVCGGVFSTRGGSAANIRCLPDKPVDFGPKVRPQEVEYIGMALTAIPRSIIEHLIKDEVFYEESGRMPWYPIFDHIQRADDQGRPYPLMEDWSLCERVRRLGYSVYALTNYQLGHFGLHEFKVPQQEGYYRR